MKHEGESVVDRGKRRKSTFKRAIRQANLYKLITGKCLEEISGDFGRFKKDKHLHTRTDDDKTNSEWWGKKNYKPSDKRRAYGLDSQIMEYT